MASELNGDTENPWVCPNDRQLALRSRLGTGWSYRSFRPAKRQHSDSSISDEEMKTIHDVMTKAEQINTSEHERISRLVDRLENMKKNALGNGNTSCLLCGENLSKMKSMLCQGCHKAVCEKCSVDTKNSKAQIVSLCKLCSEHRELWKRTGAWFFRGIPSLVPSNVQQQKNLQVSAVEGNRTPNLVRTGWTQVNAKGKEEVNDGVETGEESDYESSSISDDLLNDEDYDDDDVDEKDGISLVEDSQLLGDGLKMNNPEVEQADIISTRSTSGDLPYLSAQEDIDKAFETYSTNSAESFHYISEQDEKDSLEEDLGILEFTLRYDDMDKRLEVCLHSGQGLKAMDAGGTSDPYVKLHLLPGANKASKLRSKTQYKTLNPAFKETLTYYGIGDEDLSTKTLRLQVIDEDRFCHNDFIGETYVKLDTLRQQPVQPFKRHLLPKRELDGLSSGMEGNDRGRIQISLKYVSAKKTLVVGIIRCAGLAPMDSNGYSDPFVKCYLKPDPGKKSKRRTDIKKKTLNPEFNEEFRYEIVHSDLAKKTLEVTVWDYDVGKRNDFIGGIVMGVQSSGDVLKHWFETLKTANRTYTYWHPLQKMVPQLDE